MTSKFETLRESILTKQNIKAEYKGKIRVLSPHILGIKDGEEQCLFLQVSGESNTGLKSDNTKNWKCLKLPLLTIVSIDDSEWESALNFSEWSSCIDIIKVSAANL